jgi:hypothetical protein
VWYLLALLVPPLALLWCRKPWQALLNALSLLGLLLLGAAGVLNAVPAVLTVAAVALVLWAVLAVDRRRAPGRAHRRIREAWVPESQGGRLL